MLSHKTFYVLAILYVTSQVLAGNIDTGIELFENKNFDEAKQFFTKFIADNPDNASGFYYLGRIYFIEHDYKKAEGWFTKAVEHHEENSAYHLWFGRACANRAQKASIFKKWGLAKKAKKHFELAVELDSSSVAAREDLFAYYLKAPGIAGGSLDKAFEQARALHELNELKGRLALAQIYEKKKQLKLAEKEYKRLEEIIGNDPENYSFYNSFGYLLLRMQRYDEAIEKFEKQVTLASDAANPYDSLGDGYRAAGRLHEAKAAYLNALKIDPGFKAAQKKLKKVEKKLKKKAGK